MDRAQKAVPVIVDGAVADTDNSNHFTVGSTFYSNDQEHKTVN